MPRRIVVAACAGDAQYWSIAKSPGDPTSADGESHTHIKRENGTVESFDFIHNATVTWDGKYAAITDESGGGGGPRCDAGQTKRGFTFFFPLVEPGAPVDGFTDLKGTYIPRGRRIRRSAFRTTATCCRSRTVTCTRRPRRSHRLPERGY